LINLCIFISIGISILKAAMKKVINPMFTSKVRHALEVFGDPSSQICKDKEEDVIIKKLQVLHNMAMRAALGIGGKDRTSCSRLLSLSGQTSVGINRRSADLATEDKNDNKP
jgi:hypothetical protein